jgi:hypothetical protein
MLTAHYTLPLQTPDGATGYNTAVTAVIEIVYSIFSFLFDLRKNLIFYSAQIAHCWTICLLASASPRPATLQMRPAKCYFVAS